MMRLVWKRDQLSHPLLRREKGSQANRTSTLTSHLCTVHAQSSGDVIFLSDARLDYRRDIIGLSQVRLLGPIHPAPESEIWKRFFFALKAHRGIFVDNDYAEGEISKHNTLYLFLRKTRAGESHIWLSVATSLQENMIVISSSSSKSSVFFPRPL